MPRATLIKETSEGSKVFNKFSLKPFIKGVSENKNEERLSNTFVMRVG